MKTLARRSRLPAVALSFLLASYVSAGIGQSGEPSVQNTEAAQSAGAQKLPVLKVDPGLAAAAAAGSVGAGEVPGTQTSATAEAETAAELTVAVGAAAAPGAAPSIKENEPAAAFAAPTFAFVPGGSLQGRVGASLTRMKAAFDRLTRRAGEVELTPAAASQASVWARAKGKAGVAVLMAAVGAWTVAHPVLVRGQTTLDPRAITLRDSQESRIARVAQVPGQASLDEMIQKASDGVNVIVVGPAPDESQVVRLTQVLKGSHWKVIIFANPYGYTYYSTIDNRTYRDAQAIEFAVGHGLTHRADFAAQTNPATGKPDGVAYAIVYAPQRSDRHDYYFPSDSQNDAGLTKDAYKNDFHWKFANTMHSTGGRLAVAVQAVKDYVDGTIESQVQSAGDSARASISAANSSISELESLQASARGSGRGLPRAARVDVAGLKGQVRRAQAALDAKNFGEANQQAQQAAQRAQGAVTAIQGYAQSFNSAQTALAVAASEVDALDSAASNLREKFGSAHSGALFHPDISGLRTELKKASAGLESDPAEALSTAQNIQRDAHSQAQAIAGYSHAGTEIGDARKKLTAQQGRHDAGSAQSELRDADQNLTAAQQAYERGEPSYRALLDRAEKAINEAEAAIDRAESEAATERTMGLGLLGVIFAVLSGLGFWTNRRRRDVMKRAKADFKAKQGMIQEKIVISMTNLAQEIKVYLGDKAVYKGKTGELDQKIRDSAALMTVLEVNLKRMIDKAAPLVQPGFGLKGLLRRIFNFFSGRNYASALKKLSDEQITFNPNDEDDKALLEAYGAKMDWKEKLKTNVAALKPFSKSFDEAVTDFNNAAAAVIDGLELIDKSKKAFKPTLEAVSKGTQEVLNRKAALTEAGQDGLFQVPAVFDAAIPAASAAIAALQNTHLADPVGSMQGSGAEATRIVEESSRLTQWIAERVRAVAVPVVRQAAAVLSQAEMSANWIETALKKLSARADALGAEAAKRSISRDLSALNTDLGDLVAQAQGAAELAKKTIESVGAVKDGQRAVEAARQSIGGQIGVDPARILTEKDLNPSEVLAAAAQQNAAAAKALSAGDTFAGDKALTQAALFVARAAALVAAAKAAAAAQGETTAQRGSDMSRIEADVPKHQAILDQIRKRYAPSALLLRSGDAAHPDADGTVDNNIDEVNEHLGQAKSKLASSTTAFKAGRILEAADLLVQVKGHQDLAVHRLGEIAEKQARLERTAAANQDSLRGWLADSAKTRAALQGDRRVMRTTLSTLDQAEAQLASAKRAVEAAKGDPFQAEDALKAVASGYQSLGAMARNDADLYAHAGASLDSAQHALESATAVLVQGKQEGIHDGVFDKASDELGEAQAAFGKVKAQYAREHEDWHAVDQAADHVLHAANSARAALSSDIERVHEVARQIKSAAEDVRSATTWSDSYGYGLSIDGSPGSDDLQRAKRALSSGDYDAALRYARAASEAADDAVAQAKRDAQSRYDAEQAALAAARAAAAAAEAERQSSISYSSNNSSNDSSPSIGDIFSSGGGDGGGFTSGGSGGGDGGGW